jgi:glutamate N-acetyltransferase/amino-acid acetyltransferase
MKASTLRVPGFRAAGVHCGIKDVGLDLALLVSDRPAAAAGLFTRSSVVGAPVELSRAHLRAGSARGIVANSGISNVAMGARGRRDAAEMTRCAARAVGAQPAEFLVASTGVIGEPLPMARIRRGIQAAAQEASARGLRRAAEAIRTTDTFAKTAVITARIGGRPVTVAGIAKGSGMIEPNMATMLAFLVTDASASPGFLRRVLRGAADESFNRLTVDGETSTSDTVLLLAGGAAGNALLRGPASPGARSFAAAVNQVCVALARDLARDGEGATKLVTVRVDGARTRAEAERAARRGARGAARGQLAAGQDGALRWRCELGSGAADCGRGERRTPGRPHRGGAVRCRGLPARRRDGTRRPATGSRQAAVERGRGDGPARRRAGLRPALDLRPLDRVRPHQRRVHHVREPGPGTPPGPLVRGARLC